MRISGLGAIVVGVTFLAVAGLASADPLLNVPQATPLFISANPVMLTVGNGQIRLYTTGFVFNVKNGGATKRPAQKGTLDLLVTLDPSGNHFNPTLASGTLTSTADIKDTTEKENLFNGSVTRFGFQPSAPFKFDFLGVNNAPSDLPGVAIGTPFYVLFSNLETLTPLTGSGPGGAFDFFSDPVQTFMNGKIDAYVAPTPSVAGGASLLLLGVGAVRGLRRRALGR